MSNATHLQESFECADAGNPDQLLPQVYDELRQLAASRMASEAAGHTLQPTALVHEAWLRLMGNDHPRFENRSHFFAAAAEAMRRILIDRARKKRAIRHGGGQQRVDVDDIELSSPIEDDLLLAMNEALDRLVSAHPLEAQVVKLKYFVGLTNDEAAEALGLSSRTVKYYWTHARAWLYHEITTPSTDSIRIAKID